jgi:hypothetical protein
MGKWLITYSVEKKMYISALSKDEARYKFNRIDTSAERYITDMEEVKPNSSQD